MQLGEAHIGLRQPVAVAGLGVVVLTIRADVGEDVVAQGPVGLQRDAAALLCGRGDQVLGDGARPIAARCRQDGGGQVGGHGPDQLGAAVVVALAVVGDQGQRQGLGDIGGDHGADAPVLIAVDARIGGDVVDIAAVGAVEGGDPALDHIAERHIDGAAQAVFIAVAGIATFQETAEIRARALGNDVDDAGRGVLAEQRALRAAQHFQAVDVDQVAEGLTGPAVDHAIDDGGDRGFAGNREGRGTDPTQEQRLVDGGAGLAEVQGRHEVLRAFQVHRAAGGDGRAGDHGDGQRHILEFLYALLGGDHDFSDGGRIIGGTRLGHCGVGAEHGGDARSRDQKALGHVFLGVFLGRFLNVWRCHTDSSPKPPRFRHMSQKPSSRISTTRCSFALISAAVPMATAINPSRAVTSTGPTPRTAALNFWCS